MSKTILKIFFIANIASGFQQIAIASEATSTSVNSRKEIPPEIHNLCLEAKDYAGCVQAQILGAPKDDGKKRWERDDGNTVVFDPSSVKALKMNGKHGRYLEYRYVLRGVQAGTAGFNSPGVQMPSTATTNIVGSTAFTTITPGATVGAVSIPGRPGGAFSTSWRVEVDCLDYTANWDGDSESWRKLRTINEEDKASSKEARKIMDEFCPQMPRLVEKAQKKEN
jgi:hypothetical protein